MARCRRRIAVDQDLTWVKQDGHSTITYLMTLTQRLFYRVLVVGILPKVRIFSKAHLTMDLPVPATITVVGFAGSRVFRCQVVKAAVLGTTEVLVITVPTVQYRELALLPRLLAGKAKHRHL